MWRVKWLPYFGLQNMCIQIKTKCSKTQMAWLLWHFAHSCLASMGTFNVFNVVWTGRRAAVSDLTRELCGGKSCLTPRSFPSLHFTSFLQRKHTNRYLIFTEFYFIMLQTMTSRYIDTQLLLCVYVHLWVYVYVCVKRAVRPQKAEWKSREGALNGLTRQR